MIAHYLLQPELRHGMDYLAEVYLNYQTIHIEELIGPKGKNQKNMADLPPSQVYEYACEDADITLKLKNVFEPKLKEEGCYDLFREVEMPLMPVLAWMERNGVCIDTEALKETSTLYTKEMNRLEEEIHALAGEPFNIASPKQVGEVLFEKLKISEKPRKPKQDNMSPRKKYWKHYARAIPSWKNPGTPRTEKLLVHTSMPCPSLSIPKPDISTPPSIKPLLRPDD